PGVAQLDGVKRDLIVVGLHCGKSCSPPQSFRGPISAETAPHADAPSASAELRRDTQARAYNDCLNLMQTLMHYRQEPIHSALMSIRDKYSMLHLDVLILIYHFAKLCSGAILEIGAFVGGATIAAALGVRDSGQEKKLIAIDPGGSVKHKRLGTRDILRDLERNLAREGVANMVTLVKGKSFKPETISAVRQA